MKSIGIVQILKIQQPHLIIRDVVDAINEKLKIMEINSWNINFNGRTQQSFIEFISELILADGPKSLKLIDKKKCNHPEQLIEELKFLEDFAQQFKKNVLSVFYKKLADLTLEFAHTLIQIQENNFIEELSKHRFQNKNSVFTHPFELTDLILRANYIENGNLLIDDVIKYFLLSINANIENKLDKNECPNDIIINIYKRIKEIFEHDQWQSGLENIIDFVRETSKKSFLKNLFVKQDKEISAFYQQLQKDLNLIKEKIEKLRTEQKLNSHGDTEFKSMVLNKL